MNQVQHLAIKLLKSLVGDANRWGVGLDTTGEGLHDHIPPGHIRIHDQLANQYKEGGFTVFENVSISLGGREKRITLVDLRTVKRIPKRYLTEDFPPRRSASDATRKPAA